MTALRWVLLTLIPLASAIPRYRTKDDQRTCVTFDLEHNVENQFVSDKFCSHFVHVPWGDGAYDDLDIALDVNGTRFLRPSTTRTCSRTLEVFPVIRGGIVEVNCFLQKVEGYTGLRAYLDVFALTYVNGSTGYNIGSGVLNSDTHENGWHKIRINITHDSDPAYIALRGRAPPGTILIVDSFRYFDREDQSYTCNIYSDGRPESEEDSASESSENDSPENSEEQTRETREDESSPSISEENSASDSSQKSAQASSSSEEEESKPGSDAEESMQLLSKIIQKFKFKNSEVCFFCKFA